MTKNGRYDLGAWADADDDDDASWQKGNEKGIGVLRVRNEGIVHLGAPILLKLCLITCLPPKQVCGYHVS